MSAVFPVEQATALVGALPTDFDAMKWLGTWNNSSLFKKNKIFLRVRSYYSRRRFRDWQFCDHHLNISRFT
jgi:hypothetical protein